MNDKIITIFGSGRVKPQQKAYKVAFELGSLLAEAGFVIANGGYGGTMLAVAEGAKSVGGKVIGVTCSAFGQTRPNAYTSEVIVTGSLDERLDTLIKLGKAYVVLAGSTGTLLELAKVWEFKNKGFLDKAKEVILLGDYWQQLVDLIANEDPGSE
ncbi:MAG: LOG family protein, partial [Planctomycetota bacterium]